MHVLITCKNEENPIKNEGARVDATLYILIFKDLYSTAPKRGSVFIGLMTPDGAIWSRYQRTVLMR